MSKVAKQLQHSFHSPIRKCQQLNRNKKSIESTAASQEKKVTNKVIKTGQFSVRRTVAATEAIHKPENQNDTFQSQDIEQVLIRELKEQDSSKENSKSEGYQIYENGELNDFFHSESEENPSKVTDICLVNDHYILVKMPDEELTTASKRREEFKAIKEYNDNILKGSGADRKKSHHYLRSKCNRLTKIAPINEEPEDFSNTRNKTEKPPSKLQCLKIQSCWQANELELETYQTETKICKSISNSACHHQILPQPVAVKVQNHVTQKPRDIQTVSGSLFTSSVSCQVSLQNVGSLIEGRSNNHHRPWEATKSPQRRKCLRLKSFHWLLHPFRSKYCKPKPKVQAVVYKTYFVTWTKPPDSVTYGCGAKTLKSSNVDKSLFRRCRSSIF